MRLFVPAAAKSSVDPARIALTRPTNECAQCGESIFMPEWSEWLNPACARHL
ncbi:MAG: hypothetical protein WCG00_04555 [Hyphomicrobiales bacterium]